MCVNLYVRARTKDIFTKQATISSQQSMALRHSSSTTFVIALYIYSFNLHISRGFLIDIAIYFQYVQIIHKLSYVQISITLCSLYNFYHTHCCCMHNLREIDLSRSWLKLLQLLISCIQIVLLTAVLLTAISSFFWSVYYNYDKQNLYKMSSTMIRLRQKTNRFKLKSRSI